MRLLLPHVHSLFQLHFALLVHQVSNIVESVKLDKYQSLQVDAFSRIYMEFQIKPRITEIWQDNSKN